MNLKDKKIVFLGDSITEGSGASSIEKRYTDLIAKKTGAICYNHGIGGTRIARQTEVSENPRHDLDFPSRVGELEEDADIVVVFGGTNDYGHGAAPFGNFDDRSVFTFYGALHTLYVSLIEKFPRSTIVILTPLHRRNERDPIVEGCHPTKKHILAQHVDAIREVAEYYSLPVLDLFKTSGLQPAIPLIREMYMPDGLHPNDAGYEILANKIINFLESL